MQWELLGIYVAGIALEACDCRLQIGYVGDIRLTCYTFEVWIVGWVWHFVVGAISAMDILTTTDTCDYLWIKFLCLAFQLVQDFMIF